MKRILFVMALALLAPVTAFAPATAQPAPDDELRGGLHMTVHSHSAGTLLFPTDRLSFNFTEGEEFSYSSRLCSGRAPFNDLGLDFRPDYPGVDDDADGTAAVRHHVTGTITEVDGDRGTLEGTITSVLCENGVETDSAIVYEYQARYMRVSDDEVRVIGTWDISPTASTGTFADLEGHGSLQGILTCLGSATCAELGEFTDFVAARGDTSRAPGEMIPGLVGTFRDPTVGEPTAA